MLEALVDLKQKQTVTYLDTFLDLKKEEIVQAKRSSGHPRHCRNGDYFKHPFIHSFISRQTDAATERLNHVRLTTVGYQCMTHCTVGSGVLRVDNPDANIGTQS